MIDLPSPHVFGLHAVPHQPARTLPTGVEVFNTELVSPEALRDQLEILHGQRMTAIDNRELVCNADYWIRTPGSGSYSLSPNFPITDELVLLEVPTQALSFVRFEKYLSYFDWTRVAVAGELPPLSEIEDGYDLEELYLAKMYFSVDEI